MSATADRVAAASGIAFVVLLLTAMFVLDVPGHDDSEEIVNEFYAGAGGRARVVIAAYLFAAAGVAFLWFAAHLRARLRAAEGEPGTLSAVMFASSAVFVTMLFLAGALQSPTYALSIDAFGEPQSALSRAVIPHLGFSALIYGMVAAAFAIATASLAMLRTAVFPRWLAWLGFAAAALLPLSILFMPMVALPVWVVAVSVVLARGATGSPAPQ